MSARDSGLQISDSEADGSLIPEVIEFSIYHQPDNELAVNGLRYVIRSSNRIFRIEVLEGNGSQEDDEKEFQSYPSNSRTLEELLENRHELFGEVQNSLLASVPNLLGLIEDIRPFSEEG
ncbi:MAG: hypothetical protein MUF72_13155 [Elainella sp. Prado103]|nr:hypothetical protein [Elainella sp. Prado103]